MAFANSYGTGRYANFNISTGVVTATSAGVTATITSVGSGWYRCSITATATSATGGGNYIYFCNNNPTATSGASYLGATTSDIFIWGRQLVQGSDPLTYTKTEASNSNRDQIQTTAANQPAIVIAGAVNKEGTKPTLFFDGTNDILNLANSTIIQNVGYASIFTSSKFLTASGTRNIYVLSTNSVGVSRAGLQGIGTPFKLSSIGRRLDADAAASVTSSLTITATSRYLFSSLFLYASSDLYQYINGSLDGSSTTFQTDGLTSNTSSVNFTIGSVNGTSNITNMFMDELIVYNTDQTSNRTGIESNINTYYTIY